MKYFLTIRDVCEAQARTAYYVDEDGLIGIANHAERIVWYSWTDKRKGYLPAGETTTSRGAELRQLE